MSTDFGYAMFSVVSFLERSCKTENGKWRTSFDVFNASNLDFYARALQLERIELFSLCICSVLICIFPVSMYLTYGQFSMIKGKSIWLVDLVMVEFWTCWKSV